MKNPEQFNPISNPGEKLESNPPFTVNAKNTAKFDGVLGVSLSG